MHDCTSHTYLAHHEPESVITIIIIIMITITIVVVIMYYDT